MTDTTTTITVLLPTATLVTGPPELKSSVIDDDELADVAFVPVTVTDLERSRFG